MVFKHAQVSHIRNSSPQPSKGKKLNEKRAHVPNLFPHLPTKPHQTSIHLICCSSVAAHDSPHYPSHKYMFIFCMVCTRFLLQPISARANANEGSTTSVPQRNIYSTVLGPHSSHAARQHTMHMWYTTYALRSQMHMRFVIVCVMCIILPSSGVRCARIIIGTIMIV